MKLCSFKDPVVLVVTVPGSTLIGRREGMPFLHLHASREHFAPPGKDKSKTSDRSLDEWLKHVVDTMTTSVYKFLHDIHPGFAIGVLDAMNQFLGEMCTAFGMHITFDVALTLMVMVAEHHSKESSSHLQETLSEVLRGLFRFASVAVYSLMLQPPPRAVVDSRIKEQPLVKATRMTRDDISCIPARSTEKEGTLQSISLLKVIRGSIMEEIHFRGLFDWPVWICRGMRLLWCSLGAESACPEAKPQVLLTTTTSLNLYRAWVIFKGICFGAIHIGNHALDDVNSIGLAITQAVAAFRASVNRFDPLVEAHGLGASIGAHLTHNLLVVVHCAIANRISRVVRALIRNKH